MANHEYGITDFQYIAAGAAILASGGGGSYCDAVNVLRELADTGWKGTVPVRDYDGMTNCTVPDIIAPDSICYYSESNGSGFSNATDNLAGYFNPGTGKSTGRPVSVIKVDAAPEFAKATGVVASFAGLLRSIGYAGALPYSC